MGDSEPPPIEGNCAEESHAALAARNQTAIGDFRDLLLRCNTPKNSLQKVLDD
jgi:hypothetical protein